MSVNSSKDKQQRITAAVVTEQARNTMQANADDARRRQLTISSEQLFAGASEVHIEHRGALYRLKQTSLGKLILTK